ncbi:hypothetical protein [uncultured Alistipes sp.]|jgi:hypothetical protein|uniref:hypothetical protein n=1 Tax=uncultured Alistipes sp. TaxID=538949 RepID=UPI0025ECA0B1|nr:hypothetical protein [uncultured Alistipes sp.]
MKKVLLISLFTLLAVTAPFAAAEAQNIALGERVPDLKVSSWLRGQKPAANTKLTYIEFFHSSNKSSLSSLAKLKALADKSAGQMQVVVVTQEKEEVVAPLLAKYLSSNVSVAMDPDGKIFSAFGVQYVPFGVLVNTKSRALWLGNSQQLTPEIIVKSSK